MEKVCFLFVEHQLLRSPCHPAMCSPSFWECTELMAHSYSSPGAASVKESYLSEGYALIGAATSNKRSCGFTRPAPCLIFRQLWRAILSPEFPVGLVEVSATTAFCITVQLLLLPSPHRCHSGNPSPINLLHAILHSRVSGNHTYGGIRNCFRELSL